MRVAHYRTHDSGRGSRERWTQHITVEAKAKEHATGGPNKTSDRLAQPSLLCTILQIFFYSPKWCFKPLVFDVRFLEHVEFVFFHHQVGECLTDVSQRVSIFAGRSLACQESECDLTRILHACVLGDSMGLGAGRRGSTG